MSVRRVARLAFPDDRGLVAAGGEVPVEAVVAGVELPADEPLRVRCVRPVEHLRPRLEPVQRPRPARPRSRPGRAWPTRRAGRARRR